MKKVYILLADGFEIMETFAPHDILTRCGLDVKTVSISSDKNVKSAHGVAVTSDLFIENSDLSDGELLILPGGYPGYENLGNSKEVGKVLIDYYNKGKWVGAICGAPTVLYKNNIAADKKITCHSGVKDKIGNYNYIGGATVIDGNLITGDGAGHSLDFGFLLASALVDDDTIDKVKKSIEIK
ncbi:MAG: DJ-1/PfpI family protein [Fusobacteriaceae bacterium]|jgi:4-methyl-5(b-hydroxyethyl)-thiazole monophosphate biosynthesis|nr:DJ-1/PfpI family protein [Fusobacteriaceae bacterium]